MDWRPRELTKRPELRSRERPAESWIRITFPSRKPTRAASPARRPQFPEEVHMNKTHLITALLILQLGRTVSAQELSFGSCQMFGQVFGIDPLGGDMLVKRPAGDIGGLRFHENTIFKRPAPNTNPTCHATTPATAVHDGDPMKGQATAGR